MRLHSDILTAQDIHNAVAPGARVHSLAEHGSRSRRRAFELVLSGHGMTGGGYSTLTVPSGTWDEYGVTLAALYAIDPNMVVGTPGRPTYADQGDFHFLTAQRFRDGVPAVGFNHRHRWNIVDVDRGARETYSACKGSKRVPCDAERVHRW